MGDNRGTEISYLLVGLGIGSVIGILFALKSGEESLECLSSKVNEGRDYVQNKARELHESAGDLIARSKKSIARQESTLSAAVEAGKDAYAQEKSKTAEAS